MKQHHAFTLIEICASAAMLGVLLMISAQTMHALSNYQRTVKQRTIALQAIQVVSEQAGNIPWDELSTKSAQQIKIPPQLESYLPASSLNVAVDDESAPVIAKRIMVELSWNGSKARTAAPVRLTSWAFPPSKPQD